MLIILSLRIICFRGGPGSAMLVEPIKVGGMVQVLAPFPYKTHCNDEDEVLCL